MNEYQIGGGLRLLTAVEKTDAFGEFLKPGWSGRSRRKIPRNCITCLRSWMTITLTCGATIRNLPKIDLSG